MLLATFFVVPALGQVPFQFPNINASPNSFLDDDCSASGCNLADSFDCWEVSNVSETMSGLSPKLPIFKCTFKGCFKNRTSIICTGGYFCYCSDYIIKQGNDFKQISTEKEFASIFAPVETPDEAIAFAVALTGSFPKYDTNVPQDYNAVATSIEPTHVDKMNDTFKVHLFAHYEYGCGTNMAVEPIHIMPSIILSPEMG
jgi:hypothetical protein